MHKRKQLLFFLNQAFDVDRISNTIGRSQWKICYHLGGREYRSVAEKHFFRSKQKATAAVEPSLQCNIHLEEEIGLNQVHHKALSCQE